MSYKIFVRFQENSGEYDVSQESYYDAQIEGAKRFLEEHPSERPHDNKRRPYPLSVRPYWLVINGYVRGQTKVDRRVKIY